MLQVGTKCNQQFETFSNTKVVTVFKKGGRQCLSKKKKKKVTTLRAKEFKDRNNEEIKSTELKCVVSMLQLLNDTSKERRRKTLDVLKLMIRFSV